MSDHSLDRIRIEGLRLNCLIGVNDWEREVTQVVILDIVLHAILSLAGQTDSITDTVNYRTITKRVIDEVESSRFKLVEALAQRVAQVCMEDQRVRRVDVRVRKPGALRYAESVGVEISRGR